MLFKFFCIFLFFLNFFITKEFKITFKKIYFKKINFSIYKNKIFRNLIYAERLASFFLSYAASIKNNESFFLKLKQNTLNDSIPSIILNSFLISLLISDSIKKISFNGKKIKGFGGY